MLCLPVLGSRQWTKQKLIQTHEAIEHLPGLFDRDLIAKICRVCLLKITQAIIGYLHGAKRNATP